MKHLAFSIILLASLLIAGCGGAATSGAPAPMATMAPAAAEAPAADRAMDKGMTESVAQTANAVQPDRMIIYNGTMALVVKDTEATAQQVAELAKSLGGYIANMNSFRIEDLPHFSMTMRVPAENFDAARAALREMALRVDNENVNTNDVTDQYIDLEARLKTMKATETELQTLLTETRERGGKVEDIMSIYRELTNLRGQIESIQGQLNALSKQVAFSTLDVTLTPDALSRPITTDEWRPLETLRGSLGTLVEVMQGLIDFLIRLIIVVVPVLIVLAIPVVLVTLIIRWLVRRRKSK